LPSPERCHANKILAAAERSRVTSLGHPLPPRVASITALRRALPSNSASFRPSGVERGDRERVGRERVEPSAPLGAQLAVGTTLVRGVFALALDIGGHRRCGDPNGAAEASRIDFLGGPQRRSTVLVLRPSRAATCFLLIQLPSCMVA